MDLALLLWRSCLRKSFYEFFVGTGVQHEQCMSNEDGDHQIIAGCHGGSDFLNITALLAMLRNHPYWPTILTYPLVN